MLQSTAAAMLHLLASLGTSRGVLVGFLSSLTPTAPAGPLPRVSARAHFVIHSLAYTSHLHRGFLPPHTWTAQGEFFPSTPHQPPKATCFYSSGLEHGVTVL